LQTIKDDCNLPEDDEYDSDDEWVNDGNRTRWECSVVARLNELVSITPKVDAVADEEGNFSAMDLVATLKNPRKFNAYYVQRFLNHNVRTVRLRLRERGVQDEVLDTLYTVCSKTFSTNS
jgi:hypothetical protein